jgi:ATP-dependent RNA helicase RhlE
MATQQHVKADATHNFYGLGIAPAILEVLERLNFKVPTPIQTQAIPVAIQGGDVVGIAQTGTGKTLAYGIPLVQHLARVQGHGLIIVPTRELALQVDESIRKICMPLGLRTAVLIGGASSQPQVQALRRNPHVLIVTPGRLIDHLTQKNLRLTHVSILILDEADRMLDMGFLPQIQRILSVLPKERQTMLFSATMPAEIMKIAAAHMKLPTRVEIAPPGTMADRVTQELFIVSRDKKQDLLTKLLEKYQGPTLVFARTKYGAQKIALAIRTSGIRSAEIHSNRSLSQRREALDGFKSGRYRVLVATDIASRGIDVIGIELVLNYDLPANSEDYVHRIGRTARAGAGGHAITFAMPSEGREVRTIERLVRKELPVVTLPTLTDISMPSFPRPAQKTYQRGPRRGARSSGGRFQQRQTFRKRS